MHAQALTHATLSHGEEQEEHDALERRRETEEIGAHDGRREDAQQPRQAEKEDEGYANEKLPQEDTPIGGFRPSGFRGQLLEGRHPARYEPEDSHHESKNHQVDRQHYDDGS